MCPSRLHPSKDPSENKGHILQGTQTLNWDKAFESGQDLLQCYDVTGLQMQTLRDAGPQLRHSQRSVCSNCSRKKALCSCKFKSISLSSRKQVQMDLIILNYRM